jgi:hypothetical protein
MLQRLTSCDSVIRIINHQLLNEVLDLDARVRYQLNDTGSLNNWEIKLHVSSVLLEVVEQRFFRRSQNVVNFMDLVNFIVSRKQREERDDFEKDTSKAPHVHFITIISIC